MSRAFYFVCLIFYFHLSKKFIALIKGMLKDKVVVETITGLSQSLTPVQGLVGKFITN